MNNHIKALGFDLFNTLITVEADTLERAHCNLIESLCSSGFDFDEISFKQAHHEAALRYLEQSRENGRETHNRFWISAALDRHGYSVDPDDPRISTAVEAYFSAFYKDCHLIPGTIEMLGKLKNSYRLGLLSNFTHGPAARNIIAHLNLVPFFEVILVSGEIGYRKPHPIVFDCLVEALGVEREYIIYIGDDPEPDILGAQGAGLQPVWTTYVQDHHLPTPPRILSRGPGIPNTAVPRISSWDDLFAILEEQGQG